MKQRLERPGRGLAGVALPQLAAGLRAGWQAAPGASTDKVGGPEAPRRHRPSFNVRKSVPAVMARIKVEERQSGNLGPEPSILLFQAQILDLQGMVFAISNSVPTLFFFFLLVFICPL